MVNKLFIYGTLTDPEIQKEVWGRITKGVIDLLRGYKKSEIEIGANIYPLIIVNASEKIQGLVIEVSDDELKKIDLYETDAYKRKKVVLESGASAWVYVKNVTAKSRKAGSPGHLPISKCLRENKKAPIMRRGF